MIRATDMTSQRRWAQLLHLWAPLLVGAVLTVVAPPLGLVADLLFKKAVRRSGDWRMARLFNVLIVIALVLTAALVLHFTTGQLTGGACRGLCQ